jgi:hypothetical protein
MNANHQQAMIPDSCNHAAAGGTGVDRYVLADGAVIADLERARLAGIFEILRLVAYGREWVDPRSGADCRAAGDHDVRDELDVIAKPYVRANDAVRPDPDAGAELSRGVDESRRMNGWAHLPVSRATIAPISASAMS